MWQQRSGFNQWSTQKDRTRIQGIKFEERFKFKGI